MTNKDAIYILSGLKRSLNEYCGLNNNGQKAFDMAISALQAQDSHKPTAESVQNVQNEDLISKKAAIDAECEVCKIAPKKGRGHNCTYYVHGCKEIECLRALPSVQPEMNLDEWCTDCKEYDQERHCCPRWNRVIRQTLKDAQPEIIECRNCKHRGEKPIADGRYWCNIHNAFMYYCSDAERRTDDANDIT